MKIDLSDFDNRRESIIHDLMKAASEDGFFYGNSLMYHSTTSTDISK
jgi:isopenicillin N synthase-like dioxygenase